jgi:hypothetical protein
MTHVYNPPIIEIPVPEIVDGRALIKQLSLREISDIHPLVIQLPQITVDDKDLQSDIDQFIINKVVPYVENDKIQLVEALITMIIYHCKRSKNPNKQLCAEISKILHPTIREVQLYQRLPVLFNYYA